MRILHLFTFLLFSGACQQVSNNTPVLEANLSEKPSTTPNQATGLLFQSTDGGQNWQDISSELPGQIQVRCLKAHNGEVYLGTQDGLFHKSIGGNQSDWQKEYTLNGAVNGIYPGPTGSFVYTEQGRLFQNISKDLWAPAFANLGNQLFRTVFETSDKTFFLGCDNGIFKSTDQGKSWQHVYNKGWMIEMAESNGVLLCTSQEGIMRSTDGGEHWEVVIREGGVGINVEVIEGGFAAISYNTTSETRRLRISKDAGKTWQAIDAGLPPTDQLRTIKQIGKNLFCGHPQGIFRSSDGGKTWQCILKGIDKKVFSLSVSEGVVYALLEDQGC